MPLVQPNRTVSLLSKTFFLIFSYNPLLKRGDDFHHLPAHSCSSDILKLLNLFLKFFWNLSIRVCLRLNVYQSIYQFVLSLLFAASERIFRIVPCSCSIKRFTPKTICPTSSCDFISIRSERLPSSLSIFWIIPDSCVLALIAGFEIDLYKTTIIRMAAAAKRKTFYLKFRQMLLRMSVFP